MVQIGRTDLRYWCDRDLCEKRIVYICVCLCVFLFGLLFMILHSFFLQSGKRVAGQFCTLEST